MERPPVELDDQPGLIQDEVPDTDDSGGIRDQGVRPPPGDAGAVHQVGKASLSDRAATGLGLAQQPSQMWSPASSRQRPGAVREFGQSQPALLQRAVEQVNGGWCGQHPQAVDDRAGAARDRRPVVPADITRVDLLVHEPAPL